MYIVEVYTEHILTILVVEGTVIIPISVPFPSVRVSAPECYVMAMS